MRVFVRHDKESHRDEVFTCAVNAIDKYHKPGDMYPLASRTAWQEPPHINWTKFGKSCEDVGCQR